MQEPHFVTTLYNYYIANPSDWDVKNVVGEGRQRTLDGTEVTDVFYRKYEYVLKYDTMTVSDYNKLMQIVEHQVDRGAEISFDWPKFPQTISAVPVYVRIPNRGFKAGKGETAYYSEVEVIITDATNRQG